MAAQVNNIDAVVQNKAVRTSVRGNLLVKSYQNIGASGNPIRERNINLFQQGGYEANLLLNKVMVGCAVQYNTDLLYLDQSTIDNAVQSCWEAIFDVSLV